MNRKQKVKKQGKGLTTEQWQEMMRFFKWKCAYSDIRLTKKNRSVDHIIPLDKGGYNEPWNMCPMFRDYNSNKKTNNMLEWYKEQEYYSEERLQKLYEWQQYAWEKWGNK